MANINTLVSFQNISKGNVTSETAFASAPGGSLRYILTPPGVSGTMLEGRILRLKAAIKIKTADPAKTAPRPIWVRP